MTCRVEDIVRERDQHLNKLILPVLRYSYDIQELCSRKMGGGELPARYSFDQPAAKRRIQTMEEVQGLRQVEWVSEP